MQYLTRWRLQVAQRLDVLVGPPPPPGDRWAVVREVMALEAQRWPSWRIARALIQAGICKGSGEVKRALNWLRKEKERYRAAHDAGSASSRKSSAGS